MSARTVNTRVKNSIGREKESGNAGTAPGWDDHREGAFHEPAWIRRPDV